MKFSDDTIIHYHLVTHQNTDCFGTIPVIFFGNADSIKGTKENPSYLNIESHFAEYSLLKDKVNYSENKNFYAEATAFLSKLHETHNIGVVEAKFEDEVAIRDWKHSLTLGIDRNVGFRTFSSACGLMWHKKEGIKITRPYWYNEIITYDAKRKEQSISFLIQPPQAKSTFFKKLLTYGSLYTGIAVLLYIVIMQCRIASLLP